MKLFVLLFTFCLVVVQSPLAKIMSDREHAGFIGRVKSINIEFEVTEQDFGKYPKGVHCRALEDVYNESGRLIRHSGYTAASCGVDGIRESYNYAPDGIRIIGSREVIGKTAPPPSAAAGVKIDPNENAIPAKRTFQYDDAGKFSESSLLRLDGSLIEKTIYQYDSVGRLIEIRSEDASGDVSASRMYKYAGNNKFPTGSSNTDFRGLKHETTTYSEYKFNAQGDWIRRKVKTELTLARSQTLIETRTIEYWPK